MLLLSSEDSLKAVADKMGVKSKTAQYHCSVLKKKFNTSLYGLIRIACTMPAP